jgi:hypothetical protein
MFGVLPEASWLLLTMTLLLALYAWLTGRMEFMPWVAPLALFSFLIGFANDSNFNNFDGIDYITHSLLGTGILTLILNQASSKGILYKWADEAYDDPNGVANVFNLGTIQSREHMTSVMRIWTIVCLTLSWTAFKGIGTMIGAAWATYDAFINGQKYSILAMPLLHAFAIWNLLDQMNQSSETIDYIVGAVLLINGIAFTVIASKTEIAWNWSIFEWDDTIEYYGWIDRVGQLGIAYFLIGIVWAIGEGTGGIMLWTICAVFLSGVAIQGFRDETETPWRRGIGSMGCIFALFMLSLEFETDIYTYITWMFLGVVALGFGFAYISRMGEVSNLYAEDYIAAKETIEGGNKEIPEAIPEPILSESQTVEEVNEEEVVEDNEFDELESMIEEDKLEEEEEDVPEQVSAAPMKHFNYDLELDPTVLGAIQDSLSKTPHEGFKPIVSIAKNGNLKIDFVQI